MNEDAKRPEPTTDADDRRGDDAATAGEGSPDDGLSRREFGAAVVGTGAVAGSVPEDGGPAEGATGDASRATQPRENPVEVPGWQVAEVRVERQFTFVGASAILYNAGETTARRAELRYRLYGTNGRLEFEAEEQVPIPPGEERRVSRWWERDRPGTTTPAVSFADVEILRVRS